MNNKSIFSSINYTRLSLCFVVIVILSLSVHAVMLQIFQVPYPSEQMNALLPKIINNMLMMWGVIWLDRALKKKFFKRSVIFRISILFLLLLCINETFRGWFMNAYCSNPSSKNWLYFAISLLPQIIFFIITPLLAAGTNNYFHNRWACGLTALISGLFLSLIMPPLTSGFNNIIMVHLSSLAPTGGWCQLPYGIKVLIPAYLTFIEPATCRIILYRINSEQYLSMQTLVSSLEFMLLIMSLKKQLLIAILYAIYAPLPFIKAFISMGQFTLEAMVLSFFIAISWDYAKTN